MKITESPATASHIAPRSSLGRGGLAIGEGDRNGCGGDCDGDGGDESYMGFGTLIRNMGRTPLCRLKVWGMGELLGFMDRLANLVLR